MANPLTATLLSLGELTADTVGASVDLSALRRVIKLSLEVLAVDAGGGSPSAKLQTSQDGENWRELYSRTLPVKEKIGELIAGVDRYVRLSVTVPAGSSVTLSSSVEAHQVYCEPEDVRRDGIHDGALRDVSKEKLVSVCLAVTDLADGYLGAAFKLPLVAFGQDLRLHCVKCAVRYLLDARGWDPDGADAVVMAGYDQAISWLTKVAKGTVSPAGLVDSSPEVVDSGSVVVSAAPKRETFYF